MLSLLWSYLRRLWPQPAYTLMWYVLSEFLVSFVLTLSAMTILMLLFLSLKMAADYSDFGVTSSQVLMLSPFILPMALALALPPHP